MANQTIYTVGGTVQAGGGIYIPRKADEELLGYCRASEFAFILSSRQVGKSSLMVRTARQLESENIRSVIIDLSGIGVRLSADEWYLGILNEISNTLNLQTDIFAWWSNHIGLTPAQRMTSFFRDVLLKEASQPIVLFFDEIDSTLSLASFSDDFFAALRAIYNARSTVEDFKRLSFVMIGVATPGQLIADSKRTPFNIGHRVDLTDFTFDEALPLAGKLDKQVLNWILAWTGGHPYLTQRLCEYLSKSKTALSENAVANAVKYLFEGELGRQDNNLQFVRDMLTKRSPDLTQVLKTYKDIRAEKKVTDDERSIAKAHLKISGVVRSENGLLFPRNQIYKKVFTVRWAQSNIPQNWAKVAALAFGLLSFALLSIFIYDFVIGSLSSQYSGDFYTSRTSAEKMKNLAGLFEIEGILQNTDYDFRARELFYNLKWNEQANLFKNPSITLTDKQKYLPVIIKGLYVTMANIEGERQSSKQDSSDLLKIMQDSLMDVKTSESMSLQSEIGLWLNARNAATDQDALIKYDAVIQLNSGNLATIYERALVELRLGKYEQALLDLDTTMGLAQNLSNKDSEGEITTPTPRSANPQISNTITPTLSVPRVATQTLEAATVIAPSTSVAGSAETPFGVTPTSVAAIPTEATATPTAEPDYPAREGYKSSFYSIAYIRGAVDLAIQNYREAKDFNLVLTQKSSALVNLTSAGLIAPASSPAAATVQPTTSASGIGTATVFSTVSAQPVTALPTSDGSRALGIDVASWDAVIDWQKVKATGVEFVFMKASEGDAFIDSTFADNWQGAKSVGIPRGAYHFFRANVDPAKQAEHFIRVVREMGNNDNGELPPALDVETDDGMSKEQIISNVKIWFDLVEQGLGRKPIIVSKLSFLQDFLADANGAPPVWAKDYPLWLMQYPNQYADNMQPPLPRDWSTWAFWMYTDQGAVDGINAKVDMNVFNGTSADLQQFIINSNSIILQQPSNFATATSATLTPSQLTPISLLTYTVQVGDSLSLIAMKFGISIDALMKANGITNPNLLTVGQVLIIPVP